MEISQLPTDNGPFTTLLVAYWKLEPELDLAKKVTQEKTALKVRLKPVRTLVVHLASQFATKNDGKEWRAKWNIKEKQNDLVTENKLYYIITKMRESKVE